MTNQYNDEQIMLCLSYLADVGANIPDTGCDTAERIYRDMLKELSKWDPIKGQWTIVWGPAVFKFPFAKSYDNVLYIAQSTENKDTYTIATSGTNPSEITDWLFEDFLVSAQLPWPYGNIPPQLDPKISFSTWLGLAILENMKPCPNLPGAGLLASQYLANAVASAGSSSVNLYVTGHSLGGALSSVMALWLADTQTQWDPNHQTTIQAYCYAGPTAGNTDFATYLNGRLGENAHRIWNSLDVVPHAWNVNDLQQIPTLYEPQIPSEQWMINLVNGIVKTLQDLGLNYEQIEVSQELQGQYNNKYPSFLDQMRYQHVQAYLDLLGLGGKVDLTKTRLFRAAMHAS